MKEVPGHEQLFVSMDANARTGRRGGGGPGSEDCKVLGAYGRDTLNDNGERLLSFATNHDLALVNTFFGLTVSEKMTETMQMPILTINAAGQHYRQTASFIYLGGAITEIPNLSVEID